MIGHRATKWSPPPPTMSPPLDPTHCQQKYHNYHYQIHTHKSAQIHHKSATSTTCASDRRHCRSHNNNPKTTKNIKSLQPQSVPSHAATAITHSTAPRSSFPPPRTAHLHYHRNHKTRTLSQCPAPPSPMAPCKALINRLE
ncbi:Hypothetical predicted protein [Olea europaea subsp. europaea]|uniref:Uncharacterized protein n=1 Tax=Olea europaea subsp. europaea TaxID=158383 RepID=A0A8S0SY81_OLEEU|nr:Hypothetical predicted protein [Olea europaea subsp. europaea]